MRLNPAEIIFRDARILGSSGVSPPVVQEVIDMVGKGRTRPVVSQVLALSEVPQAIELMRNRRILGRVVINVQ